MKYLFAFLLLCLPAWALPGSHLSYVLSDPRTQTLSFTKPIAGHMDSTPVPIATINFQRPVDVFVTLQYDAVYSVQNRMSMPCTSYVASNGMEVRGNQNGLEGAVQTCSQFCGGQLDQYHGVPYAASPDLQHNEGFTPGSDAHGVPFNSPTVGPLYLGRFWQPTYFYMTAYDRMGAYGWAGHDWYYGSPLDHVLWSERYSKCNVTVALSVVPTTFTAPLPGANP
jgi:hypothetical protein